MAVIIPVDPRIWRMTEDDGDDSLDANVRRLMTEFALWGHHERDSRRTERGWVDWVILGPNGSLFRELKTQRAALKPDQREVGARLQLARLDWAVWRPVDLFNGTIHRQMERIAW